MSNAFNFAAGTVGWAAGIKLLGLERGVLLGNASWFGLAALYFGALNKRSVYWMITKEQRNNKDLIKGLAQSMGFLGGMNAGFVVLSALLLTARSKSTALFKQAGERRLLFTSFAVAHFSQFYFQRFNPPGVLWYIYWMDLAQALANIYAARCAIDDDDAVARSE